MNRYAYQAVNTLNKNTLNGKRNYHPVTPRRIHQNPKARRGASISGSTGQDQAVVAIARLFRGTFMTGEPGEITWYEPGLASLLFE